MAIVVVSVAVTVMEGPVMRTSVVAESFGTERHKESTGLACWQRGSLHTHAFGYGFDPHGYLADGLPARCPSTTPARRTLVS